jgi:Mn2+/Fe2+ NRAMP family transporter
VRESRRGFTLVEATVSILILVMMMVIALSLLFSMKSFAERQQSFTVPRQAVNKTLEPGILIESDNLGAVGEMFFLVKSQPVF